MKGPDVSDDREPANRRQDRAWINQPLTVGVLVVLATFLTQQWGWKQQQRFLAEQARAGISIQEMQDTIEDTASAVGRVLTASAVILGAHREGVGADQLKEAIDQYHALQREWDLQEDLLKHKIRNSFPIEDVSVSWEKILLSLGELDAQILVLHEFNPNDSSQEHNKQIELIGDMIEKIEQQLASLTDQMAAHLRSTSGRST